MGSRGQLPAHNRFAKDITVGLRWNITPEFMLRAEYHRVNGTGWLSTLDNPVTWATCLRTGIFSPSLVPIGSSTILDGTESP